MLPTNRQDLESFGYSKLNDSRCRGCNYPIEWWLTPRGKKMPFNVSQVDGEITPHWHTCPKAKDFRRG